jgi:thioesterase domain-containing protein
MDPQALERYLHDHIPLTTAMGVLVRKADAQGVVLAAPLAPNLNHRQTAFGGSIGALATVAAWSWLHLHAQSLDFPVRLVIRSSSTEFLAPVEGDFEAICDSPEEAGYDNYRRTLTRRGKGRIELGARVEQGGRLCATFAGTFVAVRSDAP